MANTLKLQAEPVTQAMFDRLPALLTAHQVKLVTGANDNDLADLVKEGKIEARKRPVRAGCKKAYSKYTKVSVARWTGFKV
jgi:hypothetical protein